MRATNGLGGERKGQSVKLWSIKLTLQRLIAVREHVPIPRRAKIGHTMMKTHCSHHSGTAVHFWLRTSQSGSLSDLDGHFLVFTPGGRGGRAPPQKKPVSHFQKTSQSPPPGGVKTFTKHSSAPRHYPQSGGGISTPPHNPQVHGPVPTQPWD